MSVLKSVRYELNEFLETKLGELLPDCVLLWASAVDFELVKDKPSCYIYSTITSENQDTLSVDVGENGRRRFESVGIYNLSFFIPKHLNNGYNICESALQELKNDLRIYGFENCWVRNVRATNSMIEHNSYRFDLSFTFIFNEII